MRAMASAKKKTLKERFLSFFGVAGTLRNPEAAKLRSESSRPRAKASPRATSDELSAVLPDLRKEQIRLSEEVERTLSLYDDRTRALAMRLKNAGDSRSIERIRADQEDLWRTVRRLQAALRATRDLESELREWAARAEDEETIGHPEHPVTRIEIVASELRARGRDPFALLQSIRAKKFKGSAEDVDPISDLEGAQCIAPNQAEELVASISEQSNGRTNEQPPEWNREESEHILREICDHAREARRMQAHVSAPDLVHELARTIADYRRYHGYLKAIDRADGMRRDRLAIAEIEG